MIYVLLWIEALAGLLLWVAGATAVAAHGRSRWPRRLCLTVGVLAALAVALPPTMLAGMAKFSLAYRDNGFAYFLSLLLATLVGAAVVIVVGGRRCEPGLGAAAGGWPRGKLAVLLLGTILVFCTTVWTMEAAARTEAAAIRQEAGALMAAAAPPSTADACAAGLLYDRASAMLRDYHSHQFGGSPLDQVHVDIHDPGVIGMLKGQVSTIAMLQKAAASMDCRFERDYTHPDVKLSLPYLWPMKMAATLLQIHARRELADGRVASAVGDVGVIFRMGRHAGEDPYVVSALVGYGIQADAAQTLAEILPAVKRADELDGLKLDDPGLARVALARGLEGDEALGLSILADVYSGAMGIGTLRGMITVIPPEQGRQEESLMSSGGALGLLYRMHVMSHEVQSYATAMDEFRQATQPYFMVKAEVSKDETAVWQGTAILSVLMPAFDRTFWAAAQNEAMLACSRVGVAATRYRLDHATLPTRLQDLVPGYLDEIPIDPFDGHPLRLAIKPDRWIVYSVGYYGVDHGGRPTDNSSRGNLPFTIQTGPASPPKATGQ